MVADARLLFRLLLELAEAPERPARADPRQVEAILRQPVALPTPTPPTRRVVPQRQVAAVPTPTPAEIPPGEPAAPAVPTEVATPPLEATPPPPTAPTPPQGRAGEARR
jgi:hypothetical protein